MRSGSLSSLLMVLSLILSTACTTGRMVPLTTTQPGVPHGFSGLKTGDRLRVHTRDGGHVDLRFDHASDEGDVFGQNREHVHARDIATLERRSTNQVRTTLLVAAIAIGALFVIAILADDGIIPTGTLAP
jgi:hypothetical protein